MPRQEQKLEVNQFIGGLNTDATELTTPDNTSTDEDNFDLLKEGTRRRRLGFDLESASVVDLAQDTTDVFIGTHRWEGVAKQGEVNYEVVQVGSTLHFFDISNSTFVSGKKSFTVDLDTFKAPKATRTDLTTISVASGKGALFVTGDSINPFYIEYDNDTDSITTTAVPMQIRDLTQLDTQSPESGTLTSQRKYDLLNQGWYQTDVIIGSSTQIIKITTSSKNPDTSIPGFTGTILDGYIETFGENPPKTKPWWIGKGTITVDVHIKKPGIFNDTKESKEVEAFSKEAFDLFFGGNTVAPLGHYLVDPFYKDRSNVSGIQGIAPDVEVNRPTAVAFYGGRAFYGLNNTIYFSQVIRDDLGASGRCYQEADPTAEDTVGLVASDGGVITIPDMGNIIRMFVVEGALLIFADNGIWTLYSPQGEGFSATSFDVDFVTNLQAVGYHSIVDVEGFPVYWGEQGVYSIRPIQDRIAYDVVDLSDRKIKNYIQDNISYLSKTYAKGAYDLKNKRVIWLWKSTTDPNTNRFLYDRVLNYSLVFEAFFPYSVAIHAAGDGNDKTKAICGLVESSAIARATQDIDVCADVNPTDVEWHYPLDSTNQYADIGPNSLADITPAGTGTITDNTATTNFPLTTSYFESGITNTDVVLPMGAMPDRGTGDWTLEFWWNCSDNSFSSSIQHAIFIADTSAANTLNSMAIFTQGTGGIGSPVGIRATLSSSDDTALVTTINTTFSDDQDVFVSLTRNGNSVYLHANGILQDTLDVTGLSYNWNESGAGEAEFLTDLVLNRATTAEAVPAYLSDCRFSNEALYSSSGYSVPTTALGDTGVVTEDTVISLADGNVVTTQTFTTESEINLKFLVLQDSTSSTDGELGAGQFNEESFLDWDSTGFSDDYTSYIETFYHLTDDAMLYMQAPWIYTYIKRSSTTYPAAEGDGNIPDGETGGDWSST